MIERRLRLAKARHVFSLRLDARRAYTHLDCVKVLRLSFETGHYSRRAR